MTPRELIDNFGGKFGLTAPEDNPYLDEYYLNNVPLEQVWNQTESNPFLEVDSILGSLEDELRGDNIDPIPDGSEETDISESNQREADIAE